MERKDKGGDEVKKIKEHIGAIWLSLFYLMIIYGIMILILASKLAKIKEQI